MTQLQHAEAIGAEISARLAAILVANGCETDIGQTVFRGKRKVNDDEIGTGCSVLIEGDDTITDRPGRKPVVLTAQRYVLGAYVPCNSDHPNDAAHKVLRDLKRAVFARENATFDGKVVAVQYMGRDIGPRADGVSVVFAMIEIDVHYVEELCNP